MNINEYNVLYALYKESLTTQREIAEYCKLAVSTVNVIIKNLTKISLIESYQLTFKGIEELDKYKVDNAIIMAAGLSTRFAPLSYENPKGLLKVKGEVLIERQIRQLREVGIEDIILVVGYMKEKYYYLEEKFDVKIVINNEYFRRNNNSTLYLVKGNLTNSYVCSSDNYFIENVFESHVYSSYYSSVFVEGQTNEYCITADARGRIDSVTIGGRSSWIMLGHVYFSRDFSRKFIKILESIYDKPEVVPMLWEDIYIRYIDKLDMYIKKYDTNKVLEFDTLEDLRKFDKEYINNTNSKILHNICSVMKCKEGDIGDIIPIKKGLTNTSFIFVYKNKKYVYRHPGVGTEETINRKAEALSQKIASELELDKTFIYMNVEEGWKISKFKGNCIDFDYRNENHVREGIKLVKKLHDSNKVSKWEFDVFQESEKLIRITNKNSYTNFEGFEDIREIITILYHYTMEDEIPKRLCHNDCYAANFLLNEKEISLIDWEYSGNADPASDLGTFICCSDYTMDEANEILEIYFERKLSEKEKRHYLAYVAICSYYWFVWALYKESLGEVIGEYTYIWYKYAKEYSKVALALYKNKE